MYLGGKGVDCEWIDDTLKQLKLLIKCFIENFRFILNKLQRVQIIFSFVR